jgi:transposase InsO family protein
LKISVHEAEKLGLEGIRGFHSGNGSDFINATVAKLLDKLLIEQTKSRPRKCGDNSLVEAKSGVVIANTSATDTFKPRPQNRSTTDWKRLRETVCISRT